MRSCYRVSSYDIGTVVFIVGVIAFFILRWFATNIDKDADADDGLCQLPQSGQSCINQSGTTKEELGRATWTLLHSIADTYPENPSPSLRTHAANLIKALSNLYPCGKCQEHFQRYLEYYPIDTSTKRALQTWMCNFHNDVNRKLNKPLFNCQKFA